MEQELIPVREELTNEENRNFNIDKIYDRITLLIENAKRNVILKVNSEMTMLY